MWSDKNDKEECKVSKELAKDRNDFHKDFSKVIR